MEGRAVLHGPAAFLASSPAASLTRPEGPALAAQAANSDRLLSGQKPVYFSQKTPPDPCPQVQDALFVPPTRLYTALPPGWAADSMRGVLQAPPLIGRLRHRGDKD